MKYHLLSWIGGHIFATSKVEGYFEDIESAYKKCEELKKRIDYKDIEFSIKNSETGEFLPVK